MSLRVPRYACRTFIAVAFGFALTPATCRAQDPDVPPRTLMSQPAAEPAPPTSGAFDVVESDWAGVPQQPLSNGVAESVPNRHGVLMPILYMSFGALQVADTHSTLRALRSGAIELNPLFRHLGNRPATFVVFKAGLTASTILLTEQFRAKNPKGAIVLMAALNSAYALLVVHNYHAIR